MKVKVIEEFRDKHTGELRRIGDILDITAEREKEILSVGRLVEQVTGSAAGRKGKQSRKEVTKNEQERRND